MAAGIFVITELRNAGDPATADEGERFEWTADTHPTIAFDGVKGGGARACPVKPWNLGGEQRTVRTDYPNARTPSEQVLGPRRKPFTLKGRWLDKWNGAGYALAELDRFEAMCERGNLVRFQYGSRVVEGIVTDWDFPYERDAVIPYEFTVSVHSRPEKKNTSRAPETPKSPSQLLDAFDVAVQAMIDSDSLAPRSVVGGTLADDITSNIVDTVNAREAVAATIDSRDVKPIEQPVDAFTRIATQFRQGRAAAYNLILLTSPVRADLDMGVQTAIATLEFEDWIRSLRFNARIVMGKGREGDIAATERADPSAVRLYRPGRGEHLYAISRKFYGTPHAWRLIYDRNALTTFHLLGTETLIIPERGGV